jgi:hypothetical protein
MVSVIYGFPEKVQKPNIMNYVLIQTIKKNSFEIYSRCYRCVSRYSGDIYKPC